MYVIHSKSISLYCICSVTMLTLFMWVAAKYLLHSPGHISTFAQAAERDQRVTAGWWAAGEHTADVQNHLTGGVRAAADFRTDWDQDWRSQRGQGWIDFFSLSLLFFLFFIMTFVCLWCLVVAIVVVVFFLFLLIWVFFSRFLLFSTISTFREFFSSLPSASSLSFYVHLFLSMLVCMFVCLPVLWFYDL